MHRICHWHFVCEFNTEYSFKRRGVYHCRIHSGDDVLENFEHSVTEKQICFFLFYNLSRLQEMFVIILVKFNCLRLFKTTCC